MTPRRTPRANDPDDPAVARREPRGPERSQALARGLRILGIVNRLGSAGASAIARAAGLPVSTTARMLYVLRDLGVLQHDALSRRFNAVPLVATAPDPGPHARLEALLRPRLRAWSAQHGMPVLLCTLEDGLPFVRISTDLHWRENGMRIVEGEVLGIRGSVEAVLLRRMAADAARTAPRTPARTRRHVARATPRGDERHVAVPLQLATPWVACLSIRGPRALMDGIDDAAGWARRLEVLADDLRRRVAAQSANATAAVTQVGSAGG